MSYYLGFDPGRDKCGVVVMEPGGKIFFQAVIAAQQVSTTLTSLLEQYPINSVVMGNQTTAKQWQEQLTNLLPSGVTIHLVDEHNSTLEARQRYWQLYPPRGLTRLLPQGLRVPPRPVDDVVAILLVERFLSRNR